MARPVVVVSDVPVFRAGLEEALAKAGLSPEHPSDLKAWARNQSSTRRRCGAFVTVRAASDLEAIRELSHRGVTVVAGLAFPEAMMFAYAIAAGATTCVALNAEPPAVVAAMSAAFQNLALLPSGIACEIARQAIATLSPGETKDFQWLHDLAGGATVATLAATYGYSERQMYRNLRDLYGRIGASGRVDAIGRAIHLGLI